MTLESQAEFARRLGKDRSYVTRLKQAGRLVMVGSAVDVDASLKAIEQSANPAAAPVAERWGQYRADRDQQPTATVPAPAQQGGTAEARPDIGGTYQAARAMRERYNAMQAKLEYERAVGKLIEVAAVRAAATDIGATTRAEVEQLPDRLAPELAAETDEQRIHALLSEACEDALRRIAQRSRQAITRAEEVEQ